MLVKAAKVARLLPHDLTRLVKFGRGARVAALLRPERRSDWVLARLLCQVQQREAERAATATRTRGTDASGGDTDAQQVTIVTTEEGARLASLNPHLLPGASIQPLIKRRQQIQSSSLSHSKKGPRGNGSARSPAAGAATTTNGDNAVTATSTTVVTSRDVRAVARWAILNDVRHIAFGDTRTCAALNAVSRMDGGDQSLCVSGLYANGLEALPPNVIDVHTPLASVPEDVIDATYDADCSGDTSSNSSGGANQQLQQRLSSSSSTLKSITSETLRASALLSTPAQEEEQHHHPIDNSNAHVVDALLRSAQRRRDAMRFLVDESDAVIRACVLEASHWGYVVVRRSAIHHWWHTGGKGGGHVAVHAMARIVAHVSGAAVMPQADDEHIARLMSTLMQHQQQEHRTSSAATWQSPSEQMPTLAPMPKGRTVGGIVVRPATGRFAKRVLQANRQSLAAKGVNPGGARHRSRRRGASVSGGGGRQAGAAAGGRLSMSWWDSSQYHPDDLMILTREPDHESGSLLAKRMRGTRACSPLDSSVDGAPIYWDHRFVLSAVPTDSLMNMSSPSSSSSPSTTTRHDYSAFPFEPRDVYAAVLHDAPTHENGAADVDSDAADVDPLSAEDRALIDTELYVRQLRRADWERITAITARVRDFQVPYECIRALPAVVQKPPGSTSLGQLVASPHLGISARPDLCFAAVRMPRFRSLPWDMDPGFCQSHLNHIHPERAGRDKNSNMNRNRDRSWDRGGDGIRQQQQKQHQRYGGYNGQHERRSKPY